MAKVKHPVLMVVVATAVGIATWALQRTEYRHTVDVACTTFAFTVAGRMVYGNIKSGQYRFRG